MTRRRSPLSGATPSQLAALRALVIAYRDWERAAGTSTQALAPNVPAIGRHMSLPVAIENDLAARVRARLEARPDADAIAARHAELSGNTPAIGAVSNALAGIHEELTRIRLFLERQAAHEGEDRKDIP